MDPPHHQKMAGITQTHNKNTKFLSLIVLIEIIVIQALVEIIWENKKHFRAYVPGYFGDQCGRLLRKEHPYVPIVTPTTRVSTKKQTIFLVASNSPTLYCVRKSMVPMAFSYQQYRIQRLPNELHV